MEPEQLGQIVEKTEGDYQNTRKEYSFTSYNEQLLQLQRYFVEKQLMNTLIWEPTLAVTGSVSSRTNGLFPNSGTNSGPETGTSPQFGSPAEETTPIFQSVGVDLSMQIAASDFNWETIQGLKSDLANLQQEIQLEKIRMEQQAQSGCQSL